MILLVVKNPEPILIAFSIDKLNHDTAKREENISDY